MVAKVQQMVVDGLANKHKAVKVVARVMEKIQSDQSQ